MTEEQTFFNDGHVLVTRSRIVIGNQTYPLGGITAIRTETTPANRMVPFLMGAFGVLLIIAGFSGELGYLLVGAFLIGLAVVLWKAAKPTYNIYFSTAGVRNKH